MMYHTELCVVLGLLTIMSIVGTVGNALVLFVFSKKKDRMTCTIFILALAFVDFITCLIVIPYTIYIEYVGFRIRFDILCKLYQFLITCYIPFSAFIMVAIAIDRYLCICHPFLQAMNHFRAKFMITCLGILAGVIGILVSLQFGVYQMVPIPTDSMHNVSLAVNVSGIHLGVGAVPGSPAEVVVSNLEQAEAHISKDGELEDVMISYTGYCSPNEFVLSSNFTWYYKKFYAAVFLICVIIVIVLYILIYHSFLAHRNFQRAQNKCLRRNKDHNHGANLKTAAILLVVIVVFVLTFLPAFLMSLQFISYNMTVFYMYFANNVANPFIYSVMNKSFRDDLRKIIGV